MIQGSRSLSPDFESNIAPVSFCAPGDANESVGYSTTILTFAESDSVFLSCATAATTAHTVAHFEANVPPDAAVGALSAPPSQPAFYGHLFDSYAHPSSHRWAPYAGLASTAQPAMFPGFFRVGEYDISDSDSLSTDLSSASADFGSTDDDESLDPNFSTLLSDTRPLSELTYEYDCILPDTMGPMATLNSATVRADSFRRNNLPSAAENSINEDQIDRNQLPRSHSDARGSHSIERVGLRRLLYLSSRVHKNREVAGTDADAAKKPMETYVQSFKVHKFKQQRPRRKGPKLFAAFGDSRFGGALSESILKFDAQK
jgi:hypothetical protein